MLNGIEAALASPDAGQPTFRRSRIHPRSRAIRKVARCKLVVMDGAFRRRLIATGKANELKKKCFCKLPI